MTNHDDLQRSLGRVEGNQGAMSDRMDRFEKLVSDGFRQVEESLEAMRKDMSEIKSRENERKGAARVMMAVASFISGLAAAFVTAWIKGH